MGRCVDLRVLVHGEVALAPGKVTESHFLDIPRRILAEDNPQLPILLASKDPMTPTGITPDEDVIGWFQPVDLRQVQDAGALGQ